MTRFSGNQILRDTRRKSWFTICSRLQCSSRYEAKMLVHYYYLQSFTDFQSVCDENVGSLFCSLLQYSGWYQKNIPDYHLFLCVSIKLSCFPIQQGLSIDLISFGGISRTVVFLSLSVQTDCNQKNKIPRGTPSSIYGRRIPHFKQGKP